MNTLIYEGLTYQIRNALFDVYKEKGCGYKLGPIVNFGHYPQIQIERITN